MAFFRENPQALILLLICVVLGVGTLIALALATASGTGAQSSQLNVSDGAVLLGLLR
jgi:hypothetical protein